MACTNANIAAGTGELETTANSKLEEEYRLEIIQVSAYVRTTLVNPEVPVLTC